MPKAAYVWDILVFQAPVTFRSSGESHGPIRGLFATLKEFDGNVYSLTLELSDECMRVVRATPKGHRK